MEVKKVAPEMQVKTHHCSPTPPLTQDVRTKGQMCTGPAAKAVAGGWRVFSKSSPEVKAIPENEMGVNPSNLWRTTNLPWLVQTLPEHQESQKR